MSPIRRSRASAAAAPFHAAVLFAVTIALGGCATGTGTGLGGGRSPLPPGVDQGQLVELAASCHLLRVGQNMDVAVTDATVIAAVRRWDLDLEEVIRRANRLVQAYRSDGPGLARRAVEACNRLSALTQVSPALVRLQADGKPRAVWLRIDGAEIGPGFAERVTHELRDKKAVGLIINSPGGSVSEARTLGRWLRANGLRVAVDRACLSACIDVLAGGSERYATRNARLGIHQSQIPPRYGSYEGGQYYVAESFRYLREMGVDPDVAIAAASVPHDRILLIPLDQALKTRLLTALVQEL